MLHGAFPSNPSKFTLDSIPDLTGKIVLVTGGNTGIGYQTCLQLGKKKAKVYLAARSQERANEAIKNMKAEDSSINVIHLLLDLQDLASVQKAAKEFCSKEDHLDVLINNAGIMMSPFALSKDGIEAQFATNHLGHFYLTNQLIPHLLKSKGIPRIVNVSSVAHLFGPSQGICTLEELNNEKSMTNISRYGHSKLANILFSKGLNERYGDKLIVNSAHPGWVNTELIRGIYESSNIAGKIMYGLNQLFSLSPLKGAMTSLYLSTSPEVEEKDIRAKYFVPIACPLTPHKFAESNELCEKLWIMSEQILADKGFKRE